MPSANENHHITLDEASEMTSRYRQTIHVGDIIGGFFGADALNAILNQLDCIGIRYYYGLNSDEQKVLVLVGVDSAGNDIYNGELAEMSIPCPNLCAESNPLNSD